MKLKSLILTVGLLSGTLGQAGGWVVGGGEILGDVINPWFLNTKPQVSYCLLIDETNFGLNRAQGEKIVKRGLEFWMRQFSEFTNADSKFPLGKQMFVQEPCRSSTELKIQFGVLTVDQLQKLQDMDRKIAISVRTDYDQINMRGKGFIYISPEQGPLSVLDSRMQQNPWSLSRGMLAQMVLIHELGHVFGIRHDSGVPLMDEDFVELMVTSGMMANDIAEKIDKGLDDVLIFKIGQPLTSPTFGVCFATVTMTAPSNSALVFKSGAKPMNPPSRKSILADFFNLEFEPGCIFSHGSFENGRYQAVVTFGDGKGRVQDFKIEEDQSKPRHVDRDRLLKVYLPKGQIFVPGGLDSGYVYFGSVEKTISFRSKVVDKATGTDRPVTVTLSNDRPPLITAEYNGSVFLDLLNGY